MIYEILMSYLWNLDLKNFWKISEKFTKKNRFQKRHKVNTKKSWFDRIKLCSWLFFNSLKILKTAKSMIRLFLFFYLIIILMFFWCFQLYLFRLMLSFVRNTHRTRLFYDIFMILSFSSTSSLRLEVTKLPI